MYYTGTGDQGTSQLFNSSQRLDKSAQIFETLGTLDELNSWLGLCSVEAKNYSQIYEIIKHTQNNLFICQAQFAQADTQVPQNLVTKTEEYIHDISSQLKPRDQFVVSGGSKLSSMLDIARTLARRVEREAIKTKGKEVIPNLILVYLNRLSSLLYVLARHANDIEEIEEANPDYNR